MAVQIDGACPGLGDELLNLRVLGQVWMQEHPVQAEGQEVATVFKPEPASIANQSESVHASLARRTESPGLAN